jgi:serine/threonine-protein kinase
MTGGTAVELDDLKQAWQSVDRRLEQQNRLAWSQVRERRLEKARSGLRPLYWGQLLQSVLGIPIILLGVSAWARHWDVTPLLVAGLVVHVYGVLLIAFSGRTLWLIGQIDYAAPVVTIQKQLAELRRFYALNGMVVGLPWWLLWMPIMMALAALAGVDVYARAPAMISLGTAIGVAGLAATWWVHRWSRRPGRPRLTRVMEDSLTGASLRKAQRVLDDVMRFEREEAL